jgi:hypothetical protein
MAAVACARYALNCPTLNDDRLMAHYEGDLRSLTARSHLPPGRNPHHRYAGYCARKTSTTTA